ncbi:MAG: hypothetical protein WCF67_04305 [Chitinophagaceae bacterium]
MIEKKQFTIDEWFYHWLADETKYLQAAKLLLKILDICDKIVLQKSTPLARKFYQLDVESGKYPPQQREVIRIIKSQFLSNSLKIHWIDEVDDLSEGIELILPRKDVYLVKMCLKTEDKILVTTDQGLYDSLIQCKPELNITPIFAEQFIENYLSS